MGNGVWEPDEEWTECVINQYGDICEGHSEWSERYQRNIWISDDEEC